MTADSNKDIPRTGAPFRWDVPDHFNFGAHIDTLALDPDRPALLWEDANGNRGRATFADIAAQSNRIANVLIGCGIHPGDRIIVAIPDLMLWPSICAGVLKTGAVAVALDSRVSAEDFVACVNLCAARVAIMDGDRATSLPDLRSRCPALAHLLVAASPRLGWTSLREAMRQVSPLFTPASTRALDPAICYRAAEGSASRLVRHSHASIWSNHRAGADWLGLRPGDIHWAVFEVASHPGISAALFAPWMNGVTTFIYHGPFNAARAIDLLERYRVNSLCASERKYRMLNEAAPDRHRLFALRQCTSAGAPLSAETLAAWRAHCGLIVRPGYGRPEIAVFAANPPGTRVKPGSLGLPFPGHEVVVLDRRGDLARDGHAGELAIRVRPDRPPSLFLDYYNDPAATASGFRGDYYLTGISASRDAEGYLSLAEKET